jgi:hypothetical protein
LRQGEPLLTEQISDGQVLMHGMVLGELAIGTFKNRQLLLKRWRALPFIQSASDAGVLEFLEAHQLMGKGIGWIDLHLNPVHLGTSSFKNTSLRLSIYLDG